MSTKLYKFLYEFSDKMIKKKKKWRAERAPNNTCRQRNAYAIPGRFALSRNRGISLETLRDERRKFFETIVPARQRAEVIRSFVAVSPDPPANSFRPCTNRSGPPETTRLPGPPDGRKVAGFPCIYNRVTNERFEQEKPSKNVRRILITRGRSLSARTVGEVLRKQNERRADG